MRGTWTQGRAPGPGCSRGLGVLGSRGVAGDVACPPAFSTEGGLSPLGPRGPDPCPVLCGATHPRADRLFQTSHSASPLLHSFTQGTPRPSHALPPAPGLWQPFKTPLVCVCVCVRVRVHTLKCAYTHVHTHVCASHAHSYVYLCVHARTCVCFCAHVCVCAVCVGGCALCVLVGARVCVRPMKHFVVTLVLRRTWEGAGPGCSAASGDMFQSHTAQVCGSCPPRLCDGPAAPLDKMATELKCGDKFTKQAGRTGERRPSGPHHRGATLCTHHTPVHRWLTWAETEMHSTLVLGPRNSPNVPESRRHPLHQETDRTIGQSHDSYSKSVRGENVLNAFMPLGWIQKGFSWGVKVILEVLHLVCRDRRSLHGSRGGWHAEGGCQRVSHRSHTEMASLSITTLSPDSPLLPHDGEQGHLPSL